MTQVSRRTVTALAAAGAGVPLLAACSGDDDPGTATDPGGTGSSTAAESPSQAQSSSGGGEPAAGIASTSDIEVGGGTIFADDGVVITQPDAGTFKGFSSTCTHQGCQVASVSDGQIHCPCHGSAFSISDGSPQSGPASSPLPEVSLSVDGDSISLA